MLRQPDLWHINKILLFAVLLSVVLYFGREVLIVVIFSGFFAMLMTPVSNRMEKAGVPRILSSLVSVLLIVAVLAGIVVLLSAQVSAISEDFSQIKSRIEEGIIRLEQWINDSLGISSDTIKNRASEVLSNAGGKIQFNKKVVKIITENGIATGVRLEDGTEYRASRIISGADGYDTLFNMLEDRFGDEKSREPYRKWKRFPSLLYISYGINRTFSEIPKTVSGHTFSLKDPVIIDGKSVEWITLHIFNHDPTLAPEGKTVVSVMLQADYDHWKELSKDRKLYNEKKEEAAAAVISAMEQKFPGIRSDIEVSDVATPVTFERYTGNWKGSFEGWLLTPENSGVMMKPMSQTIHGLSNFYMCGQWVEPGGGLPTSIMSARRLIKKICSEDRKKFRT